jgi:hypothetical protein
MKKTVTKTREHTIHVCDLCELEFGLSPYRCFMCGREACYRCCRMLFAGRWNDLVEMHMHVCKECQRPEWVNKVEAVLADANRQLNELVAAWKQAAAEKAIGPPEAKPSARVPCPACGGRGGLEHEPAVADCNRCGGTGTVEVRGQ